MCQRYDVPHKSSLHALRDLSKFYNKTWLATKKFLFDIFVSSRKVKYLIH